MQWLYVEFKKNTCGIQNSGIPMQHWLFTPNEMYKFIIVLRVSKPWVIWGTTILDKHHM